MAGKLDLNDSPRTLVFRKLVSFVRNDATIKRVVRPTSIRAWEGTPLDSSPFDLSIAPALRFTPMNGPEQFWSPGSTRGPLFLNVELMVAGSNVDDLLNLWWALVRAIYPQAPSDTIAHVRALQQAGAYDGLATFTQPAQDTEPSGAFFHAAGQIKIDVTNTLLAG